MPRWRPSSLGALMLGPLISDACHDFAAVGPSVRDHAHTLSDASAKWTRNFVGLIPRARGGKAEKWPERGSLARPGHPSPMLSSALACTTANASVVTLGTPWQVEGSARPGPTSRCASRFHAERPPRPYAAPALRSSNAYKVSCKNGRAIIERQPRALFRRLTSETVAAPAPQGASPVMPFAASRRTYGALRASGRSPSRQTVILQKESPARELHLPRGT